MSQIVPTHIGFIVDGNRRWAKSRGLPQFEGHRRGKENLKKIAKYAIKRGIKYVSAFVFSTENWARSAEEVSYLMELTYQLATKEIDELHKEGIRIRWLGSKNRVSARLQEAITRAEEKTAKNTKGQLLFCFNYGGHLEIADAFKKMMKAGVKPAEVTPEIIAQYLYAPDVPPIDLMVRTSGEQRISNFMLWRVAYAELYFIKKHWPALKESDIDEALADYAGRERRFGGDSKVKPAAEPAKKTA